MDKLKKEDGLKQENSKMNSEIGKLQCDKDKLDAVAKSEDLNIFIYHVFLRQ